jgi:hypothetical protein
MTKAVGLSKTLGTNNKASHPSREEPSYQPQLTASNLKYKPQIPTQQTRYRTKHSMEDRFPNFEVRLYAMLHSAELLEKAIIL